MMAARIVAICRHSSEDVPRSPETSFLPSRRNGSRPFRGPGSRSGGVLGCRGRLGTSSALRVRGVYACCGEHLGGEEREYAFPMASQTFHVVFEDAGDGWVYAHVAELPEVHTQGQTVDEAREMTREAIELVLADRRERGEPMPTTSWAMVESLEVAA